MKYKNEVEGYLEQLITISTSLKNGLLENKFTKAVVLQYIEKFNQILERTENLLELEPDES